jgi:hypothetical protein
MLLGWIIGVPEIPSYGTLGGFHLFLFYGYLSDEPIMKGTKEWTRAEGLERDLPLARLQVLSHEHLDSILVERFSGRRSDLLTQKASAMKDLLNIVVSEDDQLEFFSLLTRGLRWVMLYPHGRRREPKTHDYLGGDLLCCILHARARVVGKLAANYYGHVRILVREIEADSAPGSHTGAVLIRVSVVFSQVHRYRLRIAEKAAWRDSNLRHVVRKSS